MALKPVPPTVNAPRVNPWGPVVDGFEQALALVTPQHPQYPRRLRLYRTTCRLARRRPVAAVNDWKRL